MARTGVGTTPPDGFLRPVGALIVSVLFVYLTFDHGGLYSRSRALLSILILTFISLKLLLSSGPGIPRNIAIAGGLYFFFFLISTLYSTDLHESAGELIFHLCGASGFVTGYYLMAEKKYFKPFFVFFMSLMFIHSIIALYYHMVNPTIMPRAFGQFFQPNVLGTYLVIFLPGCLACYLRVSSNQGLVASGLALGAGVAALLATDSTGALVSATIPMAGVLIISLRATSRRRETLLRGIAMVVFSIAIFLPVHYGAFSPRQQDNSLTKSSPAQESPVPNPESSLARFHFWQGALEIFKWRPLIGSGPGTFGYHYTRYQTRPKFYSRYPHNYYLDILSGGGIFVFICFGVILILVFHQIIRGVFTPIDLPDEITWGVRGLALGLAGCLIHLMVEVSFHFASIFFLFWAISGMLAGMAQPEATSSKKPLPKSVRIAGALALMAISIFPLTTYLSQSLIETGNQLTEQGKAKQAGLSYHRAVKLSPLWSDAARQLSTHYYSKGQLEESHRWIDRAVSLSPYRARLYVLRGRILTEQGMIQQGAENFREAISLDPQNQVMAYDHLGHYYETTGHKQEALKIYLQVYEIYGQGDVSDIWHFRTDTLKPQLSSVYYRTAGIYLEKNQLDEGIKFYRLSLKLNRSSPAFFGLGYALYRQEKYQEAIETLSQVTLMDPDFSGAYLYLAYSHQALGETEPARENMAEYYRLEREKNSNGMEENNDRKKNHIR